MRPYHLSHTPLKQPKPMTPARRRNMRTPVLVVLALLAMLFFGFEQSTSGAPAPAVDTAQTRNAAIVQSLRTHRVNTLVGDFWRVLPIQTQVPSRHAPTALQSCFAAQPDALGGNSDTDYKNQSFAYLISSDLSQPGLRGCTSKRVIAEFGQPTAITNIAGRADKPSEQLLFYDDGAEVAKESTKITINDEFQASSETGLRPVEPEKVVNRACPGHRTILQVVAHEDDDLLFMNPDLMHAIQAGDCVRTVYMTAGDAGSSKFYWLNRERGSEAAYSLLSGVPDSWTGQTIKLASNRFLTAVSPTASGRLSLIFMHLPDGKSDGQGFAVSNFESIGKLGTGEKTSVESVDEQSVYSRGSLVQTIQTLMDLYLPDEVRTMRPINDVPNLSDHSDHITVGQLTTTAFGKYFSKHPDAHLSYYTGYPILEYPANVAGEDLASKQAAFFTYARYDGAVCGSVEACADDSNYGMYLERQYRSEP